MKVLDLHCEHQHEFEGWFGSEEDFQSQLARQLVQCPVCASLNVSKRLSAPRLNLSGAREPEPSAVPAQSNATNMAATEMQAAWLKMVRHVMEHTVDVGEQFAEEARKIHFGEREVKQIYGRTTLSDARDLLDEGIGVLPLPPSFDDAN